jgi:hypothetical protein
MQSGMTRKNLETLEVLAGERGREMRGQQAVRVDDLRPLLDITAKLKAQKAAGATPTKAEFDALVDDVAKMASQLASVAQALGIKLL